MGAAFVPKWPTSTLPTLASCFVFTCWAINHCPSNGVAKRDVWGWSIGVAVGALNVVVSKVPSLVALDKPVRGALGDVMEIGVFKASPLRNAPHDEEFGGKVESAGAKLLKVLRGDVRSLGGDNVLGNRFGRSFVPEGEPLDTWDVLLESQDLEPPGNSM